MKGSQRLFLLLALLALLLQPALAGRREKRVIKIGVRNAHAMVYDSS